MSIGPVVTRGYGSFGGIHLLVTRGYVAGEAAPASATDAYAEQGWAARDFYTPYWMGLAPAHEVMRRAAQRARETRIAWGIIPADAAAVIEPLAAEQVDREPHEDAAELEHLGELLARVETERVAWADHYGGYLRQLRQEIREAYRQREDAERKQAASDAATRERLRAAALDEMARRDAERNTRVRRRREAALALLLSYA